MVSHFFPISGLPSFALLKLFSKLFTRWKRCINPRDFLSIKNPICSSPPIVSGNVLLALGVSLPSRSTQPSTIRECLLNAYYAPRPPRLHPPSPTARLNLSLLLGDEFFAFKERNFHLCLKMPYTKQ